jgi:hypothetical protein
MTSSAERACRQHAHAAGYGSRRQVTIGPAAWHPRGAIERPDAASGDDSMPQADRLSGLRRYRFEALDAGLLASLFALDGAVHGRAGDAEEVAELGGAVVAGAVRSNEVRFLSGG